jgi:hypothetical protein
MRVFRYSFVSLSEGFLLLSTARTVDAFSSRTTSSPPRPVADLATLPPSHQQQKRGRQQSTLVQLQLRAATSDWSWQKRALAAAAIVAASAAVMAGPALADEIGVEKEAPYLYTGETAEVG